MILLFCNIWISDESEVVKFVPTKHFKKLCSKTGGYEIVSFKIISLNMPGPHHFPKSLMSMWTGKINKYILKITS